MYKKKSYFFIIIICASKFSTKIMKIVLKPMKNNIWWWFFTIHSVLLNSFDAELMKEMDFVKAVSTLNCSSLLLKAGLFKKLGVSLFYVIFIFHRYNKSKVETNTKYIYIFFYVTDIAKWSKVVAVLRSKSGCPKSFIICPCKLFIHVSGQLQSI